MSQVEANDGIEGAGGIWPYVVRFGGVISPDSARTAPDSPVPASREPSFHKKILQCEH